MVPDMLNRWSTGSEHLRLLAKMMDAALHRSFIVLKRLGYDRTICHRNRERTETACRVTPADFSCRVPLNRS